MGKKEEEKKERAEAKLQLQQNFEPQQVNQQQLQQQQQQQQQQQLQIQMQMQQQQQLQQQREIQLYEEQRRQEQQRRDKEQLMVHTLNCSYQQTIQNLPEIKAFLTPGECSNPECHRKEPKDVQFSGNCKFSVCSTCLSQAYCSPACQQLHWTKGHFKECKQPDQATQTACQHLSTYYRMCDQLRLMGPDL